jgi:hypothetical protein
MFKEDPEYHFQVEPGKITYAGDLVFRPTGLYSADIKLRNRGLGAMDWLDKNHPVLAQRYPFAYSGHYPDPFPDFYRQQRAGATAVAADSTQSTRHPRRRRCRCRRRRCGAPTASATWC